MNYGSRKFPPFGDRMSTVTTGIVTTGIYGMDSTQKSHVRTTPNTVLNQHRGHRKKPLESGVSQYAATYSGARCIRRRTIQRKMAEARIVGSNSSECGERRDEAQRSCGRDRLPSGRKRAHARLRIVPRIKLSLLGSPSGPRLSLMCRACSTARVFLRGEVARGEERTLAEPPKAVSRAR